MGEFLKSECPHCGQAIEYPAEGTGQTVPCPTCEEPFVLKPVVAPEPEILPPPPAAALLPAPASAPSAISKPAPQISAPPVSIPPAPSPTVAPPAKAAPPVPPIAKPILPSPVAMETKASNHSAHGSKHSEHSHAGRLDQACGEFASDREFEKMQPTREQIARALAAAKFKQTSAAVKTIVPPKK